MDVVSAAKTDVASYPGEYREVCATRQMPKSDTDDTCSTVTGDNPLTRASALLLCGTAESDGRISNSNSCKLRIFRSDGKLPLISFALLYREETRSLKKFLNYY